ncbi:SH3 domain-containing protein, partial [Arthrobacter halodurans]
YSTAKAVASVKQGVKVTVTHTYASWSKVSYAGRSGWMPSYALKTPVAPPKPKVVDVRDKTMQVVGNQSMRASA